MVNSREPGVYRSRSVSIRELSLSGGAVGSGAGAGVEAAGITTPRIGPERRADPDRKTRNCWQIHAGS
jgi:hypothetical protein